MKLDYIILIFQFGTVACAVCKRKFDLNQINYHLSNSKECHTKYPKEALNDLLLKNKERKTFIKNNCQEENDLAKSFAEKQKASERACAAMAKSVATWRMEREKSCRERNLYSMKKLSEKIEIEMKSLPENMNQEVTNMKSKIKELYEKIEKQIDDAILISKDYQKVNDIAKAYYSTFGVPDGKRYMLVNLISSEYDKLYETFKKPLKAITNAKSKQ